MILIKKKIQIYLDFLKIDKDQIETYIQRSWATISVGSEVISKHQHLQSHLSFSYYLKKSKEDSNFIIMIMKKKINLTAEQRLVLFEEGTEPPGSSELNNEKRKGSYYCANCDVKLFDSNTKYESGSGWPSFFQALPDVFETKTDHY